MGAAEVSAFLTSLAVQGKVAASTQNQALSALAGEEASGFSSQIVSVDYPLANQMGSGSLNVILDLEEVTVVDVEVVRFLDSCEREGIELLRCPAHIREGISCERRPFEKTQSLDKGEEYEREYE